MKTLTIIASILLLASCSKDDKQTCESCKFKVIIPGSDTVVSEITYRDLDIFIPIGIDRCLYLDTANSDYLKLWYKGRICE